MKEINNRVKNTKTIKWVDLKNWEFNDLKDKKRDISKLKNSIVNRGFIAPFFVWADHNYVIDGNGRNIALLELEFEGYYICDLPYVEIEAENLQEAKSHVLRISSQHGSITKKSFIDFSADLDMKPLLEELNFPNLNLNFMSGDEVEEDDFQPPKEAKYKVVKGDMFQLGEHRLMCGDSSVSENINKLLDGNIIDLVFTDPPYNINYDFSNNGMVETGQRKVRFRGIKNDNMSDEEFEIFIRKIFNNIKSFLKVGGSYYISSGRESTIKEHKKL